MFTCSVCSLVAEPSFSIIANKCKHAYHVDCSNSDDYDYCPACASSSAGGGISSGITTGIEPHTTDGIDYVIYPGTKKAGPSVILSSIASVVKMVKNTPAAPVKETPLDLLKKRVPIKTIMTKYGYGLDHMLKDGIDIDDFLSNGYKLDDLMQFEYISKEGPTRSLQTFTNGLNLTATHLKLYADRLPIDKFRQLTDITNGEFSTLLGLYFKEDGPLCCDGIDHQWNARDCVKLGLTMDDLTSFGLKYIEQYQDLMAGLTEREQLQAEKALKVKAQHLQGLRSFVEEEQEQLKQEMAQRMEQEREPVLVEEQDEPPYMEEESFQNLAESHFEETKLPSPVLRPAPSVSRRAGVTRRNPAVVIPPERSVHKTGVRSLPQPELAESDIEHVPASFRRLQKAKNPNSLIVYK